MNKKQAKELLVQTVTDLQGCKGVDLVAEIARHWVNLDVDPNDLLEEMVKEGKLVEIEYVLPNMDYRTKSFYLPAKSKVFLNLNASVDLSLSSESLKKLERKSV